MRTYRYLNPKNAQTGAISSTRAQIQTAGDVIAWMQQTGQRTDAAGNVTATFEDWNFEDIRR